MGTEFAGRQLQYEMFCSAAQHVVDGRVFRSYDWTKGRAMVDRCLKEYSTRRRGDAPTRRCRTKI